MYMLAELSACHITYWQNLLALAFDPSLFDLSCVMLLTGRICWRWPLTPVCLTYRVWCYLLAESVGVGLWPQHVWPIVYDVTYWQNLLALAFDPSMFDLSCVMLLTGRICWRWPLTPACLTYRVWCYLLAGSVGVGLWPQHVWPIVYDVTYWQDLLALAFDPSMFDLSCVMLLTGRICWRWPLTPACLTYRVWCYLLAESVGVGLWPQFVWPIVCVVTYWQNLLALAFDPSMFDLSCVMLTMNWSALIV